MRVRASGFFLSLLFVFLAVGVPAADDAALRGTVIDPLGGAIGGARIEVVFDGRVVSESLADGDGRFVVAGLPDGRYVVAASAPGFERGETAPIRIRAGARAVADLTLQVGGLRQEVVVTASASAVLAAQVGAPIAVIDAAQLERLGYAEVLEALRGVPGVGVVQAGQRGGVTGLFVRGGNSNFNKVLIDGMPANDIGGAFDFAHLATTGVERVEVLRGSNSVIYGSDAMAGVVDISTRHGRTRRPEGVASVDAGNLSTSHADVSLGGTAGAVDYFSSYSHLRTDNDVPNSAYRNSTMASRAGVVIGAGTSISATIRRSDSHAGSPNAFAFFGIADDSLTATTSTYGTVTARTQFNDRWQSTIRFGATDQDYSFENPTPTGTRSDSSPFANYLGQVVTITGGNGDSVTGQAILDFCCAYPSLYSAATTRQLLSGQTNYQVAPSLNIAGGLRLEREHGVSDSGVARVTNRHNYGGFVEGRGSLLGRVFVTAGLGLDRNEVFGRATTPRLSVAAYLRTPSASSTLGETKITMNAGRGIKAPGLDQELSSVFALIPAATAASAGITPIGPERSRTLDLGAEQRFAGGRARLAVAYFDNDYTDLVEYVGKSALPRLGVPAAVVNALSFGAYANSQSSRSRGVETSAEAAFGDLNITGSYMYLDAEVTKSLSSGALFPMVNPAFPGIRIGQYSPLVGNRPFRRPANSGSVVARYSRAGAQVSVAGYFFGKADDSTYLSDAFFGASMLLPNQDLDPAHRKFDVAGSYRLYPRVRWYLTAQNAFNQRYRAASGFPSLPRVVRSGVTVTLGGESPRR